MKLLNVTEAAEQIGVSVSYMNKLRLTPSAGIAAAPNAAHSLLTGLALTERQITILREAVEIAYADDDAPIYDRPEGSAEVAGLYRLLGGLRGVAFPTSGPSTVR